MSRVWESELTGQNLAVLESEPSGHSYLVHEFCSALIRAGNRGGKMIPWKRGLSIAAVKRCLRDRNYDLEQDRSHGARYCAIRAVPT